MPDPRNIIRKKQEITWAEVDIPKGHKTKKGDQIDVKAIIPEMVKDIDETKSFYSMDDGKLTAVLVKAVQELSAKVTALENA